MLVIGMLKVDFESLIESKSKLKSNISIFKLAQGEYIAPEKIEIVYGKHEIVAQSFVYGDSLQSTIVAIVVPDEEQFVKWAHANGFPGKSISELVADDKVCKAVQKVLDTQGCVNGLKGFENVKAVYLTTELFSTENDCMTPTFKLKVKIRFKSSVIKQNSSTNHRSMPCMLPSTNKAYVSLSRRIYQVQQVFICCKKA